MSLQSEWPVIVITTLTIVICMARILRLGYRMEVRYGYLGYIVWASAMLFGAIVGLVLGGYI